MKGIETMPRGAVAWALFGIVLALGPTPAKLSADGEAARSDEPTQAAASTACADCHEEVVDGFAAGAHGRAFRHWDGLSEASCASCHGDATAHVEAGDGSNIVIPSEMTPAQVEATCLECHSDNASQTHWKGSLHQRRGVTCLDCHSIHEEPEGGSMVRASLRTETCYRCHQDVRAEMSKVSRHPVREGKMTCFSCHDPHGSITTKNLRASSVNELCYDCHTEKRGPFLWEHAPVRENCLNCHTPHGSNHLKLQSTSVPYICQQCHINTRHPGTLYDATRLPTLDNPDTGSNRLFNRACVDCHAAIHGSNHPSSPYLGF